MSKLQPPRGTHDLLPEAQRAQRYVTDQALSLAQKFGFSEISTPIFESTSVFKRSLGDASDIVNKEMYTFEDRGGSEITLRPEGTAGVARAVVSQGLTRDVPLKFFYQGPMFRYERPQKGRTRQFNQLGVELIGVSNPLADIEVITLAWEYFKSIGLQDKVQLELNSIGDSNSRNSYRSTLVDYLEKYKKELSEDSQLRLKLNPLRILDSKDKRDQEIIQDAPSLMDHLNDDSKAFFEKITSGLERLQIPYVHNTQLVRGLDYYCHCVFEFTTTLLGAQNAVLAGGRYDHLISTMGGPEVPGVGWASGVERLSLLLGSTPQPDRPVFICPMGDDAEMVGLEVAAQLRTKIPVEFTYSGNLGKRMKKAHKANARAAVIIGSEELANEEVQIKDFDTGEQKSYPLSEVSDLF